MCSKKNILSPCFLIKTCRVFTLLVLASVSLTAHSEDTSDKLTTAEIVRFLNQATFGADKKSIEEVRTLGVDQWIDTQIGKQQDQPHYGLLLKRLSALEYKGFKGTPKEDYDHNKGTDDWDPGAHWDPDRPNRASSLTPRVQQKHTWWIKSIFAEDQLRQRVAFALSELLVVSASGLLNSHGESLAAYYDVLADNAFGSFRNLVKKISMNPAMGIYLTFQGNQKYDPTANGQSPDENYARELMQLFTIGVYQLERNGELKTAPDGSSIPSYTQDDVEALARIFTGWTRRLKYVEDNKFAQPVKTAGGYNQPMECVSDYHDTHDKQLSKKFNDQIISGSSCEQELDDLLDVLINHPNTAPRVSKHLIMRLVTSNPAPEYVEEIAQVFTNNNGNLGVVIKTILTSAYATPSFSSTHGMVKSPVVAKAQFYRALDPLLLEPVYKRQNGVDKRAYTKTTGSWSNFIEATRQKTVFNFYLPNARPVDQEFPSDLVSPEASLFSAPNMAIYTNTFSMILKNAEVRGKILAKGKDFDSDRNEFFTNNYNPTPSELAIQIDLKDYVEYLGKRYNIQEQNISDTTSLKKQVFTEFMHHLYLYLTADQIQHQRKLIILDYLLNKFESDDFSENGNEPSKVRLAFVKEALYIVANLDSFKVIR